jgi:hypothetical protein
MRKWGNVPDRLAGALMYGQCTTNTHGRYIGGWITKTPDGFAVTLTNGQRTTNTHGRYTGTLSRIVPLGHVFGPLLSSFTASSHDNSSHSARKPQKTSYTRWPLGTNILQGEGTIYSIVANLWICPVLGDSPLNRSSSNTWTYSGDRVDRTDEDD